MGKGMLMDLHQRKSHDGYVMDLKSVPTKVPLKHDRFHQEVSVIIVSYFPFFLLPKGGGTKT